MTQGQHDGFVGFLDQVDEGLRLAAFDVVERPRHRGYFGATRQGKLAFQLGWEIHGASMMNSVASARHLN